MTAEVTVAVPAVTTITTCAAASVARKRRRQILISQRAASVQPLLPVSVELEHIVMTTPPVESSDSEETFSEPSKKQKTTSGFPVKRNPARKPSKKKGITQMRYDPEVPMTKEEAAAWRREARRVRNRESAAASRQKTRDRISELEVEVESWKDKYEHMQQRLRMMEQNMGLPSDHDVVVSPCSSVPQSPISSPLLSSCEPSHRSLDEDPNEDGGQHLIEKISRPAQSRSLVNLLGMDIEFFF